jgi:hypothetical protein
VRRRSVWKCNSFATIPEAPVGFLRIARMALVVVKGQIEGKRRRLLTG